MYDKDAAREAHVNFWPRFKYQKRVRWDDHTFFSYNTGPEYRSSGTVCEVVVKPANTLHLKQSQGHSLIKPGQVDSTISGKLF
jgi:hypothetical protein